jgi:Leucine-rich repeat (LRR) protein
MGRYSSIAFGAMLVVGTTLGSVESNSSPVQRESSALEQHIGHRDLEADLASAWLKADPNFDDYDSSRWMQRFALASLYYSATAYDSEWINSDNWLSYSVDECNWYFVTEDPCSESGMLEMLDLSENELYGTLTPDIGFLRTLEYLYLNGNYLTGPIPTEIGKLTNLVDFDTHESEFNGTIPSEMGLLVNLESVSLDGNDLTGAIPSELGLLTNVFAIELQGNLFNGTVPDEVCQLISNYEVQLFVDCGQFGVHCPSGCGCICS